MIVEAQIVNRISTTNIISEDLVRLSILANFGRPFDRLHFFFGNLFHKVLFKNNVIDTRKKKKKSCNEEIPSFSQKLEEKQQVVSIRLYGELDSDSTGRMGVLKSVIFLH